MPRNEDMASLSILLAEPHPLERRRLSSLLASSGHVVRIADTIDDLRRLHRESPADLCLCALHLPSESALELLADKASLQQPIIVMVDHGDREGRIAALQAGADEVLERPMLGSHVLSTIECVRSRHLLDQLPTMHGPKSGELHEVGISDLVLALVNAKASATIHLTGPEGKGRIILAEGEVVDADCVDHVGRDAVLKLFTWSDGHFILNPDTEYHPREILEATEQLINDALAHRSAYLALKREVPDDTQFCVLNTIAMHAILPELTDQETRWITEFVPSTLAKFARRSPLSEFKTLKMIATFLERGVLVMGTPEEVRPAQHAKQIDIAPLKIETSIIEEAQASSVFTEIETVPVVHEAVAPAPVVSVVSGVSPLLDFNPSMEHLHPPKRTIPEKSHYLPEEYIHNTHEDRENTNDDEPLPSNRRWLLFAACVLLLVLGLAAALIWRSPKLPQTTEPEKVSNIPAVKKEAPPPEKVQAVQPPIEALPEAQPGAETKPSPETGAMLKEAETLYAEGHLKDARTRFMAVIALSPDNPHALLGLANTEFDLRNGSVALGYARRVTEVAPELAEPWLLIGNVWLEKHENEKAREAMLHYLKLAPKGKYAEQVNRVLTVLKEDEKKEDAKKKKK